MATKERIIHSDDVQDINHCNRVLAGPGAGKTYWITGQIRQILNSGKLGSTSKIACITYTNKAAQSIEERVGNGGKELEVSTIHAFLYAHVIKPYFHLISETEYFAIEKLDGHDDDIAIGHSSLVEIVPKSMKYFAMSFTDYSSLKRYIEKYHWHLDKTEIQLKSAANNKSPLRGFGAKEVKSYKQYVWKEYGLMHHDDVLYFTFKLVQTYPLIIDYLVAKFPFVLIDEYQDTNSIQHYIFQCIANAGAKVTIIGDKAQSIYRFAGSDINNIASFIVPDLQCFKIEDNRRSTQSILDVLNIMREDLNQQSLLKDDFGKPMIMVGEAKDNYIKAKQLCSQEDLVSLSWSNTTANSLKLNLAISGADGLLNELVDSSSGADRAKFVFYCLMAVENAKMMLMKDAMTFIFKAFHLDKNNINNKERAFKLLLYILNNESEYRQTSLADFYKLVNSLRETPLPKITRGTAADLFSNAYLCFAKEIRNKDEESMHLTIHKAKGLEYNNVFLVFDETKSALDFLLKTDLNKVQDDHRLYYVACSRAKHRLFFSIPNLNEGESELIGNKYNENLVIYANCI